MSQSFEDYLETPQFPKFVQFETNTNCNADCIMCPRDKMKRRGTAKWSLISKIIRQTAHRIEACCPFLMQEPLLEPRLVSILANLKQHNPKLTTIVYSNLSTLPEGVMEQIISLELLDELYISFYGPTPELYRKWQPPLNRRQTIANIKKVKTLRDKLKKTQPRIGLQVLAVPEMLTNIDGYKEVLPYVDEIREIQFDTFHGDIPDMSEGRIAFKKPAQPRTPCQRLWMGVTIHFDGSVVPCCIDYNEEHIMGNVNEESLDSIWNNKKFRKFRKLHAELRWNKIGMCRECRVHEYQFSEEWVTYWLNVKGINQ